MEWKTFIGDSLEIIWLDNFTWCALDSNVSAIEMFDDKVDSGKGLDKSDFLLD